MQWSSEVDNIKLMISKGLKAPKIAEYYGVSKQRMYQIFRTYRIDTPGHKKKRMLEYASPAKAWLSKQLVHRRFKATEIIEMLDSIETPSHCPILGIPLEYDPQHTEGVRVRTDSSPSLDQVVPGGGYTPDNIRIISWRANRIKNDGTAEEHEAIARYIRQNNS